MKRAEYYCEDELVQKLQSGEFDHVSFINYHSKEWQEEYIAYCRNRQLDLDEESAEAFIEEKGNQLEQAIIAGEA